MILLLLICAAIPSAGTELSKALFKAAGQTAGSEGWYRALSPYVERNSTNSLGRLTPQGFKALREEFEELKAELLKLDPPLDLKTELTLATDALKSAKINDLPKFALRMSRICALVGRLLTDGPLTDATIMFRCGHLELLVSHHGIRAYMPENER